MLKLLLILVGAAGGAAAATSWMLADSSSSGGVAAPNDRLNEIKSRFLDALDEGRQEGKETEKRLRDQLDSYRVDPDRPLVKSAPMSQS